MEWIKFTEKMPEKDISVLVFDNGSYHIANRYGDRMYDEEGCRIEPQYWCEITPPTKEKLLKSL